MTEFLTRFRLPVLVVVIGLLVRLPQILKLGRADFPEFYRDYYVVEKIFTGHFPLLGPPSMQANFHFGPIYYYLLTPLFVVFRGHPVSLIFTGVLLYAVSAFVCYLLLQLWFKNNLTSLFGSLFYAMSIYGVHLTSYVSNPNFLPLFILLYFYQLTKILEKSVLQIRDFFWLGLIYGLAAQLHTTAALVLPLASVVAVLYKLKHTKSSAQQVIKYFGSTACGAIIISLPFIWYELTNNFQNLKNLLNFGQHHLTGGHWFSGLLGVKNFFSASLNPFDLNSSFIFLQPNWLYYLLAGATAIFLALFLKASIYRKSEQKILTPISKNAVLIAFSWLVAGTLLALLFDKGLHEHYLIVLWPLPVVLLSFLFHWLQKNFDFYLPVLALMLAVSTLQLYSFYIQAGPPWQKFFATYPRYQTNPETRNIGVSPNQW